MKMRAADCLYRGLYRTGFRLALVYWRLRRPKHRGALVAIWADQRLLVVRQSYRRALSFPGGGVHSGEQPREAALRELAEELDLRVDPASLRQVYETTGLFDGRRDTVSFFELHLAGEPAIKPDNREIVAAEFLDSASVENSAVSGPVARYLEWRNNPIRNGYLDP